MNTKHARGFTLVELLVVIAIIGVLVAATVPAIQASREMGHRNLCRANLAQLSLAMQDYENAFESFPPGVTNPDGPVRSEPVGLHYGWLTTLLPYVDEGNAARLIDAAAGVYAEENAPVRALSPALFICPSEPGETLRTSSYAGCHHDVEAPIDVDNHGMLFLNSHVRRRDVTDGLSHTLLLGEKRADSDDLGWMSGTRATLRNTGLALNTWPAPAAPAGVDPALYVGGFASPHVGGGWFATADGSVRYIADAIDATVWQQLAHRSDGKLLNEQMTNE
jgi:prepilin-type N-terminal cleavage/methylation domain-containing protein